MKKIMEEQEEVLAEAADRDAASVSAATDVLLGIELPDTGTSRVLMEAEATWHLVTTPQHSNIMRPPLSQQAPSLPLVSVERLLSFSHPRMLHRGDRSQLTPGHHRASLQRMRARTEYLLREAGFARNPPVLARDSEAKDNESLHTSKVDGGIGFHSLPRPWEKDPLPSQPDASFLETTHTSSRKPELDSHAARAARAAQHGAQRRPRNREEEMEVRVMGSRGTPSGNGVSDVSLIERLRQTLQDALCEH